MVRPKLNRYINFYLGIPYWRNQVDQDGTIKKEGPFAGKGNPDEISYATNCAAFQENLKLKDLSPEQQHKLQKKYQIGIDCSGLVYNLLDAIAQDIKLPGVYYFLSGQWRGVSRYGSRSISASNLASPQNSQKITELAQIKLGDLICLMGHDNIGHVILILEKKGNILKCIHSSSESINPTVHQFEIILDNQGSIINQNWQEKSQSNLPFLSSFNLNDPITGLYRPKFLCL